MFYFNDIKLEIPNDVYFPKEDSILLAETIMKEDLAGKSFLDMGCGSGFVGIVAAKAGAIVTCTDISASAISAAKKNFCNNDLNGRVLMSDLFKNLKGERFNIISFNPPYLPEHKYDKGIDTCGGKTGREILERFISQAAGYLNPSGKIFLIISSITGKKKVMKFFDSLGFSAEIISRKKIPWEELFVIEATMNSNIKNNRF